MFRFWVLVFKQLAIVTAAPDVVCGIAAKSIRRYNEQPSKSSSQVILLRVLSSGCSNERWAVAHFFLVEPF
jgi:hypothetical protein